MKLKITSKIRSPYGGTYSWTDPMTGHQLIGTTFEMLLNRAYDHRRANSLPVGLNFEDEVEEAVCAQQPDECTGWDPTMPRRPANLGMFDVVRGSIVMLKHKLNGSELVSPAEANQRASTCANCPYNTPFTKPCAGLCGELQHLVSAVSGAGTTPWDNDLKACGICHCFTRVAVWLPGELQVSVLSEDQKTAFKKVSHCWKAKYIS